MGYPQWLAGEEPTPEKLNALILSARKTSTEAVTSSTMQDDDQLFVAVEASAVYRVELWMVYDAPTAGDIKIGWTGPSGATMTWTVMGATTAEATPSSVATMNLQSRLITEVAALGGSTSTGVGAIAFGTLIVGSTAGTLQFQWAQNSASGTTNVRSSSHLLLTRIA